MRWSPLDLLTVTPAGRRDATRAATAPPNGRVPAAQRRGLFRAGGWMHDHPHVVLCENNAALASLLGEFLSSEGFRLTTCTALAEIETAVARDPAAVVVTDSWLGGPSARPGIDTEGLRRLAVRTTVVLTTGWTGASHLGPLQALGLGDAVRLVPKQLERSFSVACADLRGYAWADVIAS